MELKELPLSKAVLVALYYIDHEANANEVIDWLDERDYFFYKFLPEYKSIYNALYYNYCNSLVDKIGPFFVVRRPEQVSIVENIVKNIDLDDIDGGDNNTNGSEDYDEDDEDNDASNAESNGSSSWLSAYDAAMAAYSSAMEAYRVAIGAFA